MENFMCAKEMLEVYTNAKEEKALKLSEKVCKDLYSRLLEQAQKGYLPTANLKVLETVESLNIVYLAIEPDKSSKFYISDKGIFAFDIKYVVSFFKRLCYNVEYRRSLPLENTNKKGFKKEVYELIVSLPLSISCK